MESSRLKVGWPNPGNSRVLRLSAHEILHRVPHDVSLEPLDERTHLWILRQRGLDVKEREHLVTNGRSRFVASTLGPRRSRAAAADPVGRVPAQRPGASDDEATHLRRD